jgi:hypothetical protein
MANCCATAWEDRCLQPRTDATVQSTVTGGRLSDLVTYDAVTVPIDWYNYDSWTTGGTDVPLGNRPCHNCALFGRPL